MAESPTPTYPQYTNRQLGDGLFDQLMGAVNYHIEKEWKKSRITGDNYSKVYLGSIEAVLANTTQYLLGILLIDERNEELQAKIDLLKEEARQKAYETDYVLPKQVEKMDKEIDLLAAQISLASKQEDKIDKEIEYLGWKVQSEKANTVAGTADGSSLIGRQTDLLRIQGLGFQGDLAAKAAKIYADYDSVYQTALAIPESASLTLATTDAIGKIDTVISQM